MSTLHECLNTGDTSAHSFRLGTAPIATVFEPLHGFYITSVKIKVYRYGSPGGTLTVGLKATDVNGKPTGSYLGYNTMPANSVTSSSPGIFYEFVFAAPVWLAAGTKYAIVADMSAGDGSTFMNWRFGTNLSSFVWYSYWNVGQWTPPDQGGDQMFECWGTGPVCALGTISGQQAFQVTGNLTIDDITDIDDWGYDWRTYGGAYTVGQEVTKGAAPTVGANSITITGLYPATLYYFRAKFHHTTAGWVTVGYSGRDTANYTIHDTSLVQMLVNTAADNAQDNVKGSTNVRRAQIVVPAISYQLKSIKLKLSKAGTVSGDFYVAIRATVGGVPDTTDIILVTRPASFLTGTPTWYEFGLGLGTLLEGGVSYAIWVYCSYGSASDFPYWRYFTPTSQFAGNRKYSTNDINWTDAGVADNMIDMYGDPGVETHEATNIEAFQATGNGFLLDDTDIDQIGFEWGTVLGGPYPTSVLNTTAPFFEGDYALQMTGLTASTWYYYRAKVHHTTYGWMYGNEMTFKTKALLPVVRTDPPTDAQLDHIDAVGYIEELGSSTPDMRGFVYGLTPFAEEPGSGVAPGASGYDAYVSETGSYGTGSFTLILPNLNPSRVYYIRAWAHNSYGYGYGPQLKALSSYTVNILYPNGAGDESGIRFDSSPGGGYPYPFGGTVPHYRLVQNEDSEGVDGGRWGYYLGKFVYERNYYNDNFYRDLYALSNPIRRTEGIIKMKWKSKLARNGYPYGHFKRVTKTAGVVYEGSVYDCLFLLAWTCEIFYTNHNTGLAWTLAQADAYQAGISLGEEGGYGIALCDCIEVRALWANAAVKTKAPRSVSSTVVSLRGQVLEDEGEGCEVSFEWGETTDYGFVTSPQLKHWGEEFDADITVDASKLYHVRTVITTACGETFYGMDLLFPTGACLELAFNQSIFTEEPEWTDVTEDLKSLHVKRGRMHELGKVEAGTAVFKLDNADGNWWRNNTVGDFTPYVRPLTLIRLRWKYNSFYPVYYGVVESLRPGWESDRGGFTPVMEIGAVDVFKCFTRYKIVDANPALVANATAGLNTVIVDSGYGLVVGQSIGIYDTDNAEVNYIYAIDLSDPAQVTVSMQYNLAHNYSTSKSAKLKKFPAGLSGRRITDILLEVGWPLALTTIDTGQVELIEISPPAGGTNAMEALYDTSEAEDGNLFVDTSGYVIFQDSIARTKAPYNVSQATFRDDDTASKYILPELVDDDSFIYNEADISGDGIDEQIMIDIEAQALQGPRALTRTSSLIFNDYDANTQAFVLVKRFTNSSLRPEALNILPVADENDLFPKVLGYDLGTRVTMLLNSARNPAMINQAYHIEGVEHDWSSLTDLWQTKWQLWEVNKYRSFKVIHDGYLLNIDETSYTLCHDAEEASGDPVNDGTGGLEVGQWTVYWGSPPGEFSSARIERGYMEFDTSSLLSGDSIVEAYLLIRIEELYIQHNWKLVVVDNGGVNNPLIVSDYLTLGNMETTHSVDENIAAPAGWKVLELNSLGRASIVKGGTTRLGIRSNRDISAIDPGENSKEFAVIAGLNSFDGKYLPRLIVRLA